MCYMGNFNNNEMKWLAIHVITMNDVILDYADS